MSKAGLKRVEVPVVSGREVTYAAGWSETIRGKGIGYVRRDCRFGFVDTQGWVAYSLETGHALTGRALSTLALAREHAAATVAANLDRWDERIAEFLSQPDHPMAKAKAEAGSK